MKPFDFRPVARADYGMLAGWLRQPQVARWWCDDPSDEALEAEYGGPIDGRESAEVFIASVGERPIGLVQRFALAAYPAYEADIARWTPVPAGAWSLDYFIGAPDALRQGWGTGLVGQLTESIWARDPVAPAILVPVHADNRASWRVLERNGYRRAATGEFEPDNPIDTPEHYIYRIDRPGITASQ